MSLFKKCGNLIFLLTSKSMSNLHEHWLDLILVYFLILTNYTKSSRHNSWAVKLWMPFIFYVKSKYFFLQPKRLARAFENNFKFGFLGFNLKTMLQVYGLSFNYTLFVLILSLTPWRHLYNLYQASIGSYVPQIQYLK